MRSITITVPPERENATVKSILRREAHMADVQISRLKLREDGIRLNGKRVFTNARVRPGDVISVRISDTDRRNEAAPVEAPLDIVYEDEDIIVLNKSPDMAVHGTTGGNGCTVANAMAFRYGADQAFHPVNRLDRGTSGLMVIAKSTYVHDQLRKMLHTEDFRREYIAVAQGIVTPSRGEIKLPIGKDPDHPTKRTVTPSGQPAHTGYRVMSCGEDCTVLRLRPFTGRTHQLRVHMAAIGHPLLGDALYGNGITEKWRRPALHSAFLHLRQPVTGEMLELEAPLPPDIADNLFKYVTGFSGIPGYRKKHPAGNPCADTADGADGLF